MSNTQKDISILCVVVVATTNLVRVDLVELHLQKGFNIRVATYKNYKCGYIYKRRLNAKLGVMQGVLVNCFALDFSSLSINLCKQCYCRAVYRPYSQWSD